VEPLDLPGGRRAPGRRQQVVDAVLAADPVEQHLDVLRREPTREYLAVVREHLLGEPVVAHRLGEVPTDRAARRTLHHAGADHEPGVVVDPGQDLALLPVREQHPADDVHLPQLHRAAALPPFEPAVASTSGPRLDQTCALERPIDPRTRRHRNDSCPRGLVHEPAWSPVGVPPTRLEDLHLDRRVHLMRAPRRPMGPVGEPASPCASYQRSHRCTT
jgi:hypothetical protein